MSFCSRRGVLTKGSLLLTTTTIAGCVSPPENNSTTTTTPTDDIEINVQNATSSKVTVRLTISKSGRKVSENKVRISSDKMVSVDSEITEVGKYELAVDVIDGPKKSWQFDIGEYALREGSNLLVTIQTDGLTLRIEQ